MKFFCEKKHIHNTQEKADHCYICKRRARRKDGKRSVREGNNRTRSTAAPDAAALHSSDK